MPCKERIRSAITHDGRKDFIMCTSKAATQQVLDNYLSEKGYFRYGEFSKDVIAWAS